MGADRPSVRVRSLSSSLQLLWLKIKNRRGEKSFLLSVLLLLFATILILSTVSFSKYADDLADYWGSDLLSFKLAFECLRNRHNSNGQQSKPLRLRDLSSLLINKRHSSVVIKLGFLA